RRLREDVPSPSKRVGRGFMSRHQQDNRLVTQRRRIQRRPGFLITGVKESADYGCPLTLTVHAQCCDHFIDSGMDTPDRTADTGKMRTGKPAGQAEQENKVEPSDTALVFAESFCDLQCASATQLAPKNRAADDLGGELCHLAQRIQLGGGKLRPTSARLEGCF